jgi:hypothetical protein
MTAKNRKATPSPKKRVDWEAVQVAYRLGIESLRLIAAEHGCTEGAIRKKAKAEGWPRDLSAKVKAKAEELVRKAEVRKQVRTETPTERQQVEIGAKVQSDIVLAHRTDVPRARAVVMSLLGELEFSTANSELMAQLGELMAKPDDKGVDKLNDAYHKVISLSGRVSNIKALAEALKNLVALEREAFGIGEGEGDPDPMRTAAARTLSDAERAVRLARLLSTGKSETPA